jgi:hypothetical protein
MLYSKSLKRAVARKAASLYTSKSKRRKCTIPKENRRANKWVSHSFVIAGLVHAMLTHSARCTLPHSPRIKLQWVVALVEFAHILFTITSLGWLAGWVSWRAPFFATVNNPI